MKALILLFALVSPCVARIGETKEQCIKRYGPVKLSFGDSVVFQKSGLKITVQFRDERAGWIQFKKMDEGFDEEEIKTLLNANGPGVKWAIDEEGRDIHYSDVANNFHASYIAADSKLTIVTIQFLEQRAKENDKAKKEALKGF